VCHVKKWGEKKGEMKKIGAKPLTKKLLNPSLQPQDATF
jgi:hypothetical protein